MKSKKNKIAIVLMTLFMLSPTFSWTLEKDEAGIKIYTRPYGKDGLKEFRALTWVKGTKVTPVVALIYDVANYPQWYGAISQAKVLKKKSSKEIVVYIKNDAPWPVSDRDMVVDCKLTQNKKTRAVTIHIRKSSHYYPVQSGVVRMPQSTGFWRIVAQKNGWIGVTYQFKNDPGGSIPNWLKNKAAVDSPLKTMKNFRRRIRMPKYKNAKLSFVKG